jgi:tetratricopeptide (TPR) repeat protein
MLTSRAVAPSASGAASSSGAATAWVLTCVCAALFALASACSGGNPNISAAEDALEAGNYDQALASVEEALAQDSANAEAYLLKANILTQRASDTTDPDQHVADVEAAIAAQEQAIQYDPGVRGDVEGRRLLLYQREFNAGVEAFNQASETQAPEDFRQAAAYFESAALANPDATDAYLNQGYALIKGDETDAALPPLESYRARADSIGANVYALLGELYLTQGENEEAVEAVEAGLDEYPDDEDLKTVSLAAYEEAGMTERVLSVYAERVKQDPDNATYRYNYGSMLLSAERYDAAAEQLEAAVELDPDNARAQYNLGAAYVNKAIEVDEQARALEDSLASNRDDLSSSQQEAMTQEVADLRAQRQDLFARAVEPLERAEELTTDPQSRQRICSALFQSYMQIEEVEKAEQVEECAGVE